MTGDRNDYKVAVKPQNAAETLADGGVKQGLPRATAYRLAAQTCLGTSKMILEKGLHPGQIKDMVTSPVGTTIEGCEKLETGGMRGAVMECIKAAADRDNNFKKTLELL